MDTTPDPLAPSPTTSMSSQSPPSANTSASPAHTPPKSTENSDSHKSNSPSVAGDSPLPPLPAEVFLHILQYLPGDTQRRHLLFVAKSWKNFLVSEPRLWPVFSASLERDTRDYNALWTTRASVNGPKPGGGIRALGITLGGRPNNKGNRHGDLIDTNTMRARFNELNVAINAACVPQTYDSQGRRTTTKPSTLRSLSVVLEPNTSVSIEFLRALSQATRYTMYRALEQVTIHARIPNLRLSSNFLDQWQNVVSLIIKGDVTEDEDVYELEDREGWCGPIDERGHERIPEILPNLELLFLSGTTISRTFHIPWVPSLTRLNLHGVTFESYTFFYLVRIARSTLEQIECHDLTFSDGGSATHDYEDWQQWVNVKDPQLVDDHLFDDRSESSEAELDEPAPIILPNLQMLSITGEFTPPFFSSLEYVDSPSGEPSSFPTPIFVMPTLRLVLLDGICTDQEQVTEESAGALPILGRSAPNLVSFRLSSCVASDHSIFYCLASMNGKIRVLDLSNSSVTDKLIAQLPGLLPNLERIDVRGCPEVTAQGIARMVEVIRDSRNGQTRVREVRIDPPQWGEAEYHAYVWLDWVSVLVRDEYDFEGFGPVRERDHRLWIKQGKMDAQREERRRREIKEQKERIAVAENLASMVALYGTSGSSTRGPNTYPTTHVPAVHIPSVNIPAPDSPSATSITIDDESTLDLGLEDATIDPALEEVDPMSQAIEPSPTAITVDASSPTVDPRVPAIDPRTAALERRTASEVPGGQ